MRITPLLPRTSCLLGALFFVTSFGLAPFANASEPQQSEHSSRTQAKSSEQSEPVVFDLDFPGGSITDLLNAIEKASGQPPNVVLGKGASILQVPSFKMAGVTIGHLFDALNQAGIGSWTAGNSKGNTWAVRFNPDYDYQQNTKKWVHIFNIGPLLVDHNIDDIVAAIRIALDMDQSTDSSQTKLKYHKETKLLIINGTGQQIGIVGDVLKALESQTNNNKQPAAAKH